MVPYAGHAQAVLVRFNVAASIKMRKSYCVGVRFGTTAWLQCGRIYKDAEISCPVAIIILHVGASMWPHL